MTSRELIAVSKDREYQARIKYFAVKAAIAILGEDVGTANNSARVIWAGNVLDGAESLDMIAIAVLTNATIAVDPLAATESDLEFAFNSMINHFARA